MKMKKLLALCLSSALCLSTFAGCNNKKTDTDENGNTTITFWTMWDGGDVTVAKKMVDEFNTEHPNITIKFEQQDFSQYATKIKAGITSGTGPDVAIQYVGGFIQGMQEDGQLQSISQLAKDTGVSIDFANYTQNAINANKVGDDYYAVPTDNLIRVVMYNKALLKDTGYLDADGNLNYGKNYDEFMATLKNIKSKLPADVATLSLTMRPPQIALGWLTTYAQMGGKDFIDQDAKKCNFDENLAVQALEKYKAIYTSYVPKNLAPPADLEMFKSGKAAIYIDGSWNVKPAADALGDNFGVTKFPQFGDTPALITTNHAFIVPQKKNQSDAAKKAVAEFIKWWGDHNYEWSEAGHLPAYTPSTETEEFKKMPYIGNYIDTLDRAVPIYRIKGANLHQISEVTDPLSKAMKGEMSCKDAVSTIRSNLDKLIPELAG